MPTAQVVTLVESGIENPIRKASWDWLSTDGGVVSSATLKQYTGAIVRVVFESDSGDTQPTDAYDVTILDSDGIDVLQGEGANINRAAPVQKTFSDKQMWVANTTLTLTIAAAGDAKGGEVHLYVLPMK
jgi:hypothetical protein